MSEPAERVSGRRSDKVPIDGRKRIRQVATGRPRVIVDFEVDDDDTLMVVVRNAGDLSAGHIRVRFRPAFRGLGGDVVIPRLALFRRLEFLAPGGEIRALVDPLAVYLGRCEPAEPRRIRVSITYRGLDGERYRTRLGHDLGIWEDLPRKNVRNHGDRT